MITGLDLVEWQLRVASGEPLPLTQEQVKFSGHAIEARLCAEDPANEFRPQVGKIAYWQPASKDYARTDHGLNQVDEVSPYYDSMLGKVIAYGIDREAARRCLKRALSDTVILGLRTNREFLLYCLGHEQFACATDTGFVPRVWKQKGDIAPTSDAVATSVSAYLLTEPGREDGLWGWSSTGQMRSVLKLSFDEKHVYDIQVEFLRDGKFKIAFGEEVKTVSIAGVSRGVPTHATTPVLIDAELVIDDVRTHVRFARASHVLHITGENWSHSLQDILFEPRSVSAGPSDGSIVSPANGLVVSVDVVAGQFVEKETPICSIESMKLVQTLVAPRDGVVTSVLIQAGQQIKSKQLIAQIESATAESPNVVPTVAVPTAGVV
jgi:geranyl-CoA carboxylase alpha subunit